LYFEINNTIFFCVFLDKNIIDIMEKVSPDFFKFNIAKSHCYFHDYFDKSVCCLIIYDNTKIFP